MPTEFFPSGGPTGEHLGLTTTVNAPSDTNDTTNVINALEPLRFARTGTAGLTYSVVRCAAGEIPECYSLERVVNPFQPFGVKIIPGALSGAITAGRCTGLFIEKLVYSNVPPSGTDLGVQADGLGGWQVVAGATAIGKVLSISGGEAEVLF